MKIGVQIPNNSAKPRNSRRSRCHRSLKPLERGQGGRRRHTMGDHGPCTPLTKGLEGRIRPPSPQSHQKENEVRGGGDPRLPSPIWPPLLRWQSALLAPSFPKAPLLARIPQQ
jgi:hypothetical protein